MPWCLSVSRHVMSQRFQLKLNTQNNSKLLGKGDRGIILSVPAENIFSSSLITTSFLQAGTATNNLVCNHIN